MKHAVNQVPNASIRSGHRRSLEHDHVKHFEPRNCKKPSAYVECHIMRLFEKIEAVLNEQALNTQLISDDHKAALKDLASFVAEAKQDGGTAHLIFICTHNSRRSHLAAIWAQAAACYLGIQKVQTYSGGTEVTSFNPRAVAALERDGFVIEHAEGANPVYHVAFTEERGATSAFSKTYDHSTNPQSDYCAVMVCSDADDDCPVVHGAARRISLPYIDPKISDNSDAESETYTARSHEIAREMIWMLSQVNNTNK